MKKILNKIGHVLQLVLLAPVKMPSKAVNILKYIALGLGVVETVLEKDETGLPDVTPGDPEQGASRDLDIQNVKGSDKPERSEADETE